MVSSQAAVRRFLLRVKFQRIGPVPAELSSACHSDVTGLRRARRIGSCWADNTNHGPKKRPSSSSGSFCSAIREQQPDKRIQQLQIAFGRLQSEGVDARASLTIRYT